MKQLTPAQAELVRKLPDRVEVERMKRIWIFPAHQGKSRESGVIVVAMAAEAADVRGLHALATLRYSAEVVKDQLRIEESLEQEGWAPPERIERVIAGVLSRGGEESGGDPLEAAIDGQQERWQELLDRFGIVLDPASQ